MSDKNRASNIRSAKKKELILEYRAAHTLESAGPGDLRAIEAGLRRELGPNSKTSLSYIAGVLRAAGVRVELTKRFDDRYLDPEMDEPYAGRLEGVLHFGDFAAAEDAIRKLDAFYREYRNAADRRGTNLIRSLVVKGKQRAEGLARNPRVSAEKRLEKQEIAAWFRVWLEVPDLFFEWLEMRKQSEEFRSAFAKNSDAPDGGR